MVAQKQTDKATEEVKTAEAPKTETVETKTTPKKVDVKKEVKEVAVANGFSLPVSTKNCMAIGKMIRLKTLDRALGMLELVLLKKMAVPMRNMEIPHRRRGLMPESAGGGGRFPMNAVKEVINLVKQLKANCDVNGIENPIITLFVSNLASRPFKREGKRAKRTNLHIEARDKTKFMAKKK